MELQTDKKIYSLVYHSSRHFMEVFGRLSVYGIENVPLSGGALIAANHISFLDPPLIGCLCPLEMYFLARKTLLNNFVFKKLAPYCNIIPVDRDGGSDIAAFKKMFSVLKQGHSILLFPEGTRSKDGKLGKAQGGAGLIACKTRVPVVPVRVFGTNDVLPRGAFLPQRSNMTVVFGKPISFEEYDPGKEDKDRFREASRRILHRISEIENPKEIGI